ncbi:hypothetical protein ACVFVO_11395 [Advenella kashmirensis]
MTKRLTRSLFMVATFAGVAALAGCTGSGYDSGASAAADSAQAPMTSSSPATDSMQTAPAPTTQSTPMAPAPTAQP